jgi:Fe-S-cluster containining protein
MNNASEDLNVPLAEACQQACSKCCCHGKIFLPAVEFEKISAWLEQHSPGDLAEFRSRMEAHDGFHLYEQGTRCQFLDDKNLCRLHVPGVKPRECFWWPLHVFDVGDGQLEVQVSTECCSAWRQVEKEPRLAQAVAAEVDELGKDLIKKFRKVYPGYCRKNSLLRF